MKLSELISKNLRFFDASPVLAFAVAKDDKGSSKGWQITWGKGKYAKSKVKRALKSKGFSKIIFQSAHEEYGHLLNRGFWVVVKSERTAANGGKKFVSYGMGADTGNYANAEKKALLNLKKYDPQWEESYGYKVSKSGAF